MGAASRYATAALVPELDRIAANPLCVLGLSKSAIAQLLLRASVVQAALTAALAEGLFESSEAEPADRMLDADQIAAALGQTRRWVFRNAGQLPFIRRISRKSLVGSESELRRWRQAKKG
jgi:predicted DNA-binding transcriptional regulator AlpA